MISDLTGRFLEYLKFEKRFSPHTVDAYGSDLEQFGNYLKKNYSIGQIDEVSHPIVRSWVVGLMEEGLSARSVNRKITSLKTFYRFLVREKAVKQNPMPRVQAPKTSKRLPLFVEKQRMDELLDGKFTNDFEGHRDKLIIAMFYATGMRLSELVGLKESNVDLSRRTLKVLGKRNKERIIPFNDELEGAIGAYLSHKRALKCGGGRGDALFVDSGGKKIYSKLVYRVVNKYLSGVTTLEKKSPHVLRHTFATHMLNNGADLNAIKELLGHANLSATQVYTHNTVEKLKNIHKQAHPKA